MNSIKIIIIALFANFCSYSQEVDSLEIEYIIQNIKLSESDILYLKSNKFEVNLIYNFLKENGLTDDNKKFVKDVIIGLKTRKIENYTKENFPGKDEGYPFEWWKNEKWMKENLKI